ncbi:hypothetical protein [Halodesulfovibrio aestuarii]|uniref:ASCH domain-containing protein n=1 Tax=Halodesulfovibrio aestuarii TaxID=126333 RepID=A0ABV4JTV6_9BACT
MATKPILFNGPMVQAILDGSKTQTRRPVVYPADCLPVDWDAEECLIRWENQKTGERFWKPSPIATGDVLWVRETWAVGAWSGEKQAIAVGYGSIREPRMEWLSVPDAKQFKRLADQSTKDALSSIGEDENGELRWYPGDAPTRLRRSIHMPKWACRIFLEVTNVRIQKAMDMTQEEVLAEGFDCFNCFCRVWENIYGVFLAPEAIGENPYLLVYEFKRCEMPEGFLEAV